MKSIRSIRCFRFVRFFAAAAALFSLAAAAAVSLQFQKSSEAALNQRRANYIRRVDFTVPYEALDDASRYDIQTHGQPVELHWIELLAWLACRNGGDFSRYRASDLEPAVSALLSGEETISSLTRNLTHYTYYYNAYSAVLSGLLGSFEAETGETNADGSAATELRYGLKAFHPIAKNFPYSDCDDFGAPRSCGYKRPHLGHDMMGQIGTPIIAVESGTVEALGWNQYGGWRIGIRSFDHKRYYYYAHLRQNYPYALGLTEGSTVTAGDVIGYMGHTGCSTAENTSNIDITHLHFGIQLIFDESQTDGDNQIWIDPYQLILFLCSHRSEVQKIGDTREWERVINIRDPSESTPSAG